jgi:hypothetical protein
LFGYVISFGEILMKSTIVSLGVASLLIVNSLSLTDAVLPWSAQGWTSISREEATRMVGAVGPCQGCVENITDCAPKPVIADSACDQYLEEDFGIYFCLVNGHGNYNLSGCEKQDTFRDCQWIRGLWCSNSTAAQCGQGQVLNCPATGGFCDTDTPNILSTGSPCCYDCAL